MAGSDGNGGTAQPQTGGEQQAIGVRILGQYIKDLSFENPNVHKLVGGLTDKPNLSVAVNVGYAKVSDKVFESAIDFKAEAVNKTGTIYDMELIYAGLFQVENMPEQALEPFLLINCPALLFPFLRRLVADLTREGGFPPLLLDPIDFGGLYVQRQQEKGGQVAAKPTN